MKTACIAVLALFGIAGNAVAQAGPCGGFGGVKTAADIQTLLAGKYACVHNQWNELHSGGASGTLTDFKKGPSDPVNPSEQVGTYTITAGSGASYDRIQYNYGSGGKRVRDQAQAWHRGGHVLVLQHLDRRSHHRDRSGRHFLLDRAVARPDAH